MDRITKRIDETHACYAICEKECPDGIYEDNPACKCTASKMALERLLEYEDTGLTPERIRELAERDTAKTPVDTDDEFDMYVCPSCDMAIGTIGDKRAHNFCLNCGQRLKWEEGARC